MGIGSGRVQGLSVCFFLGIATACGTSGSGERAAIGNPAARTFAPRTDDSLSYHAEVGSIDGDDANEAITRHWSKLAGCYTQAGDATSFAGGPVNLRFDVAPDGRTTSVAVLDSGVGNHAVERCLVDGAQKVRFPPPHGNARATVDYSLSFRATGERAVLDLGADQPELAPTRQALLARLHTDCGALPVGEVTTTVYLDRRGQVFSAGFASPAPVPAAYGDCALAALNRAPIVPGPLGAGSSLVRLRVQASAAELASAVAPVVSSGRPASKSRLAQGRRRR